MLTASPPSTTDNSTMVLRVCGNAMNPLIHSGDTVILDPGMTPKHGHVMAYSLDGFIFIRRLFRSGYVVSLLPENPDYDAIALDPGSEFRPLGVVTHVIHPLETEESAFRPASK